MRLALTSTRSGRSPEMYASSASVTRVSVRPFNSASISFFAFFFASGVELISLNLRSRAK